ncbi:MAG: nucleotidyl transferase AbiEii/AbiGii toxin family protein [Elusimicrobia bacterium]|nr:nucleotidyl transferase AbiEii/AbiGii toxin family protein [Elusimicrobiota bacterium]
MERFLYRLSESKHRDSVVLKGALMFVVWKAPRSRATRDIDFLGRMPNTVEKLEAVVREVCEAKAEPDGIVFDPGSVKGARIKEDADYEGVRIRFIGKVGQARAYMQIDFGFGDVVFPKPEEIDYPTILDMPKPKLKGYPRETVVAEKFDAMVKLDMLNSRMKDFYDIWLLAQQFDFDGENLREAVAKTFANRKTGMSTEPTALSKEFSENAEKRTQWTAFIRRTRLENAPRELGEVVAVLRDFLLPIATAIVAGDRRSIFWKAPGPWRDR